MNFIELAQSRFSCRRYEEQAVEDEKIIRCIEAAHLAPSACNSQPWHFVVVNQAELVARIAASCTSRFSKINRWMRGAPVIIALVSEKINTNSKIGSFLKGKPYHSYDQGCACEHLCLQATQEGLGSCMVGYFNEGRVRRLLKIPFGKRIPLLITLGYPSRKTSPRKVRRDFNEIISWNTYRE